MFSKCVASNKLGKCLVCQSKLKKKDKCSTCESYQATITLNYTNSFNGLLKIYKEVKIDYHIQNYIKSESFFDYLIFIHHLVVHGSPTLHLIPRILNIFGRCKLPATVNMCSTYLRDYVQFIVKYINQVSARGKQTNWEFQGAILALHQLYNINQMNSNKVPLSAFTCTMLDLYFDTKRDFRNYKKNKFNLLSYSYVLPSSLKFRYLELETDRSQNIKFYYLPKCLEIHRENLISDSLEILNQTKLGRKLRIEFTNEEGVDAGGVIREWSNLVCDYLSPCLIEQNWISESADAENMELLGTIFGLCLFNGSVLNVNLPNQFFRWLLGLEMRECDFEFLFPEEMKHLNQLLQYSNDANFDELFGCMTFCRNLKKSNKEYALVKNGHAMHLNKYNLAEYVHAYKQSLLFAMNPEAFKAFHKGFWKVLPNKKFVNNLFSPQEVRLIIQGDDKFDLSLLRDVCIFDYSMYPIKLMNPKYPLHTFIRDFWDIVLNDFNIEQKKKFLRFTTGCDRICSARFCNIKEYDKRGFYFRVSISGIDSNYLPIAHTCTANINIGFHELCIHHYNSKEKLRHKLVTAISECNSFLLS